MLNSIADRLRYMRDLRGVTQAELSKRSGESLDKIKKIEQGKITNPTGLENIASVLDCDAGWLRYGESSIKEVKKEDMEIMYAWDKLTDNEKDAVRKMIMTLATRGTF